MHIPKTEKRISDCNNPHNCSPTGSDGPFLRHNHCIQNSDGICRAEKYNFKVGMLRSMKQD